MKMNKTKIRECLKQVNGSYDYFVNDLTNWMNEDDDIYRLVIQKLRSNPNANTDEITQVLWDALGIGAPLELIDDTAEIIDISDNTPLRRAAF